MAMNKINKKKMNKSRFAFIRTVERKKLCLQLKGSGTEYSAQKINLLTSEVANGRPLPL